MPDRHSVKPADAPFAQRHTAWLMHIHRLGLVGIFPTKNRGYTCGKAEIPLSQVRTLSVSLRTLCVSTKPKRRASQVRQSQGVNVVHTFCGVYIPVLSAATDGQKVVRTPA